MVMVQTCSCRERQEEDIIAILSTSRTGATSPTVSLSFSLFLVFSCCPAVPYEMVYQLDSRELSLKWSIRSLNGAALAIPAQL